MRLESERFLEQMARPGAAEVEFAGRRLGPGARVRLRPRPGGDVFDAALAGRTAVIEGVDEDESGGVHVAVLVDDDPGRDLGEARHPAHRFFFRPEELEPLEAARPQPAARVLVAGIGNLFFGDDAFGVHVARALAGRRLPEGLEVVDFGIRGMDLAFALQQPWEAVVLVDALARGRSPGTLHVLEPDADEEPASADAHAMDPVAVLGFARRLGPLPARLFVVGCEPERLGDSAGPDGMSMGLSRPVAAAVERAATLVVELAERLLRSGGSGARSASGERAAEEGGDDLQASDEERALRDRGARGADVRP